MKPFYYTNKDRQSLEIIVDKIIRSKDTSWKKLSRIIRKHPRSDTSIFRKAEIIRYFKKLNKEKKIKIDKKQFQFFISRLRMKNVRTSSGVTPLTVLTMPYPCPGKCIYCPSDIRMPKSYLSLEPGAQRAERNKFDPFLQTYNRLVALNNIGHATSKIEIIILGGTFTTYPKNYQLWFIKRIFDGLNQFSPDAFDPISSSGIQMPYLNSVIKSYYKKDNTLSYNKILKKALQIQEQVKYSDRPSIKSLVNAQNLNEKTFSKCVGLVVETRPDQINKSNLIRLRRLGVTKVQIGIQSIDEKVLKKNKRGHDVSVIKKAIMLLRLAGYKIQVHYMLNLYGSTPKKDLDGYKMLFKDMNFRPDEVKIYPCSLIENTPLMSYYEDSKWFPYTQKTLIDLLKKCLLVTPGYCRINRMIRDISAQDIYRGNIQSNLRQVIEKDIREKNQDVSEIRFREIRNSRFDKNESKLNSIRYKTSIGSEVFIEYVTKDNKLLGFLRLSLPKNNPFISELNESALLRELHIYGPSTVVGTKSIKNPQHKGLGKKLIQNAIKISKKNNFKKLSVISAVGTRGYYKKLGFDKGELYQHIKLNSTAYINS